MTRADHGGGSRAGNGPGRTISENVVWQAGHVERETRTRLTGLQGATVWVTGIPSSGKSTLVRACEQKLLASGHPAYILDGDNLRHGLTGDLGFTREDRAENVRRVAHVAEILCDAGIVALVALISPYAADRQMAREIHERAGHVFLEAWTDTPLAICERRDPKRLYERARRGELAGVTGLDAPYETPDQPELHLRSFSIRQSVDAVVAALEAAAVVGLPLELLDDRNGRRQHPGKTNLTLREREVLRMIERGLPNKEIASQLSITVSTVKNHVHQILDKMEADSRGHAAALFRTSATRR
jgi:adenylyl-sulfate kinase